MEAVVHTVEAMQAGCIDAEEGLQSRGKDQDKNLIFPIWLTRLLLFDLLLAPYQLGFWPQGGYASTGEREEEVEWLEICRGSGRLEFHWIENDIELAYHFCGLLQLLMLQTTGSNIFCSELVSKWSHINCVCYFQHWRHVVLLAA